MILATVKGDVHDIGKNLVEIILANNGYDVINLGIKVPPDTLIQAFRAPARRDRAFRTFGEKHPADGDDRQRFEGAREFAFHCWWAARRFRRNSRAPKSHTLWRGAYYAKDAMAGLSLMNQLMDPAEAGAAMAQESLAGAAPVEIAAAEPLPVSTQRGEKVRTALAIPPAPYLDRKVRDGAPSAAG